MDLCLNRDDLIAELKRIRPLLAERDKQKLKEHKQAEREHLAAFRQKCRDAARWDYETAKKNFFSPGIGRYAGPRCPVPQVEILDRMLALLQKTSTKRFTITPSGRYSDIYRLLTFDVPETKAVC